MQLLVNIVISSILQFLLINFLPYLWWLFSARKNGIRYFSWIGLKAISNKNRSAIVAPFLIGLVCFGGLSIALLVMVKDMETATMQFDGLGVAGLLPAALYALIQTSLTEEIFFRGFLLKRIGKRFGYFPGNLVQSVLFGLMHGAMFFSLTSVWNTMAIMLFTGIIAFYMGYINERKADGSIIPSWWIHAAANMLSAGSALFSII